MQPTSHHNVLYSSRAVRIGGFHCTLDDPRWAETNSVDLWPTVSFPSIPVRVHQADAEPFVADANTAVYFNPLHPYTRSKLHEDGVRSVAFEYEPSLACEIVARYDPRAQEDAPRPFPFTHGRTSSAQFLSHNLLFEHLQRVPVVDDLQVEETAVQILDGVIAKAFATRGQRLRARPATLYSRKQAAERVKELLATRYRESLSLETIAENVGLSPYHLCRVFREHTGLSIHHYLTRLRLRAAVERLKGGEDKLCFIAVDLGFSSHSHFTDAFRKEFGFAPSRVREMLAGGSLSELELE